jgi:hypothetical protein
MATTTRTRITPPALKIIDADTHLSEPHDLWTKRAPPGLRDRVPQVRTYRGRMSWMIDGDKPVGFGEASPNSAILKDGRKVRVLNEFIALKLPDVHPGSSQVKPRLAFMDEHGIHAQIVYPNVARRQNEYACLTILATAFPYYSLLVGVAFLVGSLLLCVYDRGPNDLVLKRRRPIRRKIKNQPKYGDGPFLVECANPE